MGEAELVPDARHARRQVRVPAINGAPVALNLPETAQLLEPLASAANPIERLTVSICSASARPSPDQASSVTMGLSAG